MTVDIEFDLNHLWHPYTSMTHPLPCYPVVGAQGVKIELEDGRKLIDGMSSWWSVIHGYNHPKINEAIQSQITKFSHVMFGGLTHEPAVELGKKLVDLTPQGLNKVFIADSGSVSVEVALKMAIQYQLSKGHKGRNRFAALRFGYHGDTFGAMSVRDPQNSMHSLYAGIVPEHFFVDSPASKYGEPFNHDDLKPLKDLFETHNSEIAALILEPVVQGAGGMRFYHPEYLKHAKALCEEYGILLIADEIATGFGRTGKLFGCDHAGITPDIMCVGKALTGGYMTLAAAISTDEVAIGISEGEAGVLMHGPTFMGNPLACAAANASLALIQEGRWKDQVANIEKGLLAGLSPCQDLALVKDVRVLGAIGVVEMHQPVHVGNIQKSFIEKGIWVRPFGKLVYVMPQYVISQDELTTLCRGIVDTLSEKDWSAS